MTYPLHFYPGCMGPNTGTIHPRVCYHQQRICYCIFSPNVSPQPPFPPPRHVRSQFLDTLRTQGWLCVKTLKIQGVCVFSNADGVEKNHHRRLSRSPKIQSTPKLLALYLDPLKTLNIDHLIFVYFIFYLKQGTPFVRLVTTVVAENV